MEMIWSPQGRRSATDNGVTFAEVEQAWHAPAGMVVRRLLHPGTMLIIAGMAETGRVILVQASRIDDQLFEVIDAVPLRGKQIDEWRESLDQS